MVQILRSWTSKSAPTPPVFNDFDFQIALARRRGANFVDILGSRSFATPVFRTYLCEPSKRQNYGKTQHFAQFLPAKISHVSHLCCKTSLLSNIDAARPTGNFQYSRKLELLNFLWLWSIVFLCYSFYKIFTSKIRRCSLSMCIIGCGSLLMDIFMTGTWTIAAIAISCDHAMMIMTTRFLALGSKRAEQNIISCPCPFECNRETK